MRSAILIVLFVLTYSGIFAQHCPWDCSGMIMLKTTNSKATVYQLKPVLVDEDKQIVIDTIYGTDKATYDSCGFLYYDDFAHYRTKKIAIHNWYQYDTFYHFASGLYIVKYNFCKYQGKKLFLRYTDAYSNSYRFLEVPQDIRIHLHEYNSQMREDKTEEIKNDLKNSILAVNCEEWNLKKQDCR